VYLFAFLPPAMRTADAHPVAQGAMEVVLYRDRVTVLATVSNEEVLVAGASRQGSASHREAVRGHGDYLLAHLQITADALTLAGRVVERPVQTQGRPAYRLEYVFPGAPPARLVLREDVLREIEFAPGTPWEASYLVRIGHDQQVPTEGLLTCREPLAFECRWRAGAPSDVSAPSPGRDRLPFALAFVRHGILHILSGYDHLLFVGALLLAAAGLWDLIKVISAITAAHTLTLALSVLDVFRLSEAVVEPMIAASIVVVAAQNVGWPQSSRGRARLLVAFGFGLFHGLGFAGGLLEAISGLNTAGAAWAIAAFSTGVEIGHQVVILPAFGCLCLFRLVGGGKSRRDRLVRRCGSAVISVLGMFYVIVSLW
jgi:hypothetical protein